MVAVVVSILMVKGLNMNVNTIGDLYTISTKLPTPGLPQFDFGMVRSLFSDAFTIAIF